MTYSPGKGARLLGGVVYDPATVATASLASLLAMTALDTTNLRVTFTAPPSGKVEVKMAVALKGGAVGDGLFFLGVLDGATVKLRVTTLPLPAMTTRLPFGMQARGLVLGLTPGTSYTWDMAYGVERVNSAGLLGWGGPNNTTTEDAYGAAIFEVWEVLT